MDDLLDSEIQFSEWTDSLEDEWMDIEQPINQESLQENTINSSDANNGGNASNRGKNNENYRTKINDRL